MTSAEDPSERTRLLISQLVDGDLSAEEMAELNGLVQADTSGLERVVDQLLLDSLLTNELGSESLTALLDMVTEAQNDLATVSGECRGSLRGCEKMGLAPS